ncbi:MAG: T9SS type A sorting domain-containing protein [Ignavibacteriales bacterium]|nr:T9SS type A sorting domain-containing protein [Ignavibacteriales bacterium]
MLDVNNIRISKFYIDEIHPNSISISNENTINLTTENILENGEHEISYSKLRDFYNTPIQDSIITFQVNIDKNVNEELIISSYEIIDNYNLIIRYNFSIDSLSSLNINNYTLLPNNMVKEIIFEKNKNNSVVLTTEKPFGSIGREYILSIKNVFSSAETGNLPISENSGSQIILTSNSANLDEIYVYPNPINIEVNQSLTFANLTQFVEIYIFNLEGKFINQLNEDDGNGGLTWNLQDEKGSKIPSGIYIYKAISKDSQGNELQEKISKFAVTR